MAAITLHGDKINTNGDLPAVGSIAPDFTLTTGDLADVTLADFSGKKKLLNIVPSLDTGVCAISAKTFNESAGKFPDAVFLTISADLPFAQGRFCEAENVDVVKTLSTMRSPSFAEDYGIKIIDGPLAGITARGVIVLDKDNKVVYTELVPEIAQEPNYDAALATL